MTTAPENALSWPALDLAGTPLPGQLAYERGIWGKVHGAPTDFRWIATTAAFDGPRRNLERDLPLGSEDAPASTVLWRTLGESCYAVAVYPSRARDAAGRSSSLEKQILEWKRPPEVPAALGALLLLPAVAALGSDIWWEHRADIRWQEQDYILDLGPAAHPPLPVPLPDLASRIDQGLLELSAAVPEDALAELYAALLAGGRSVPLRGLAAPLSPAALAALLLPLPRSVADRLSVAGWLPSLRLSASDVQEVQRSWDLTLGGSAAAPPSGLPTPSAGLLHQARLLARAVFAGTPPAVERSAPASGATARRSAGQPLRLALWGPSAAGKTVLLAKLYLEAEHPDWDIFPTEQSAPFIEDMRERMQAVNLFPPPTTYGRNEQIEYTFRHRRTGLEASLRLEDRAGRESEELNDDLRERLTSADGLVLLLDPFAEEASLETRVWRALERIYLARGLLARKDDRPVAVCVSKADMLIETPADFRAALGPGDDFVRSRIPDGLVKALDRFCADYRLFPVSAAGVRRRHGVIEPTVFYDENLEPRICPGGRAFNLMAPFSWLLQKLAGAS